MRPSPLYLLLVAVATGGAAVVGGGWWTAVSVVATERQAEANRALGLALNAARQAREAVPRALDPADRLLGQIQSRQTALARGDRREAELAEQALLALVRRGQDGIRVVAATDANGNVTFISHQGSLPKWLGNQDFFLAHRYGRMALAVGRTPSAAPGSQPGLLVSRPLLGRDGGFTGIALVVLESSRLAQALPTALATSEPMLALYHVDGGLLARGRGASVQATPQQLDPRLRPESGGDRVLLAHDPRDRHAIASATAQVVGHDLVVAATLDDTAGGGGAGRLALTGYGLATALTALWLGALGWLGLRARRAARSAGVGSGADPASGARMHDGRATALLPSVIEAMPTASYAALVGQDGSVRVTAFSPGLERLTGWPPAVFQDPDRWQRNIDWASYPPGQPLPERLLQEPEAEVEYRLKRADGRWMWLRETCRVVARDASGIEVLGSLQDVTREHDLARQAEQAARAATQGMVAAGLAHDLKGPLQTISYAAQNGLDALATGTAGTEEVRQRLLRVVTQSERASAIARQLGDFSRLEALRLEAVSLPAAVRAVMAEVAQPLQEAGVEVQLRLTDNLPPVRGLPLMVEQVLVNLCLNARDAMQAQAPGQRVLRVSALYRANADQVEVTVVDTGGGVPLALLERVFEMHFSTKEKSRGSGLGLTLCRFIMTRFGGSIALRNVPGGAEARLVFRRAPTLAATMPPQPPDARPPGPGGEAARASAAG